MFIINNLRARVGQFYGVEEGEAANGGQAAYVVILTYLILTTLKDYPPVPVTKSPSARWWRRAHLSALSVTSSSPSLQKSLGNRCSNLGLS